MQKNKKLLLTAAVSAAVFVGGISPVVPGGVSMVYAASMPSTYTKDGVTYEYDHQSGLMGIYYNINKKRYALVTYSDDTYATVASSMTGTYTDDSKNIAGALSMYDDTFDQEVSTTGAVVSGGSNNISIGQGTMVSGGTNNIAIGEMTRDRGIIRITKAHSTVFGGKGNTASGENSSVSGGENNTANSKSSSVFGGSYNTASGTDSLVSGGQYNTAKIDYSSVFGGMNNTASGQWSSAFGGWKNTASGENSSVSGGENNTANVQYSSVFGGSDNNASGQYSSVFGGKNNIVVQNGARASIMGGQIDPDISDEERILYIKEKQYADKQYSTALGGENSVVGGYYSTAVAGGSTGYKADNSLAAGSQSVVTVANGTAIGYQATTNKDGTIAFGHDAGDVSGYTVTWEKDSNGNIKYEYRPTITENTYSSAYYNRLVKIADGIDAHDAVTVGQLNKAVANAGGGVAYTAGSDIDISSANAISVKKAGAIASGNTGLVTGGTVYSTTNALNTQITATSQAVESLSDKISTYGKTISSISTSVTNTLSSMKNTQANFVDTSLSNISSDGKDVIKQVVKDVLAANTASTTSSTASAKTANLLKASFVAAPMRAAANLTAGDHVDISGNTISVKADGTVASGNAGLVTGGTVYDAVKGKADKSYVDEGLAKKADISYVDQGLSQKVNVSDFTPVKQQVETNTSDISALKTGKADADGSNINVGSFTAKLNTGKVEKGNTGLVSGGAVYDSLQTKADVGYVNTIGLALDSEIKGTAQGLHNEIQDMGNRLTKDINRVGAGSAALAALHPQDFNPDDKWDFAVGYGHYKNVNASAVGAFYRPNAGTTVSLAATIGNGDPQVSAGVSFKIGMGKNVEKVVITKDKYDAQQRENQEMKAEIEELKQAIMKMQAK